MDDKVAIRPARVGDAGAVARVHVESWRSTYRGLLPENFLNNLDIQRRLDYWRSVFENESPGEFALVAEHSTQGVVGFVSGGPALEDLGPYSGQVYAIYLLASQQGQGIGRAMFEGARGSLVERDYAGFMLWVLEGNPTCGFYEHMGGQLIGRKEDQIGGQPVTELAYGWAST
ncbi:MAG: GNAT family N-acetyltransferase [Anaerolineales bacterium]|nr:GNAT family N-acetyltransferase [Anaerolineales bacterium]